MTRPIDHESIDAAVQSITQRMPSDVPWSRQRFIELVSEMRDRPIILWPVQSSLLSGVDRAGTTCGLWVARQKDDIIVYGSDVSNYHGDHNITHEVGHMVLDHRDQPDAELSREMLRTIMPNLSPRTIAKVLGRSSYQDRQEVAAERFADLLMVEAMTIRQKRQSPLRSTFFRAK